MGLAGAKRTERPQVPSLPKDPTSKVPKIVNDNGVNVNAELSQSRDSGNASTISLSAPD